MLYKLSFQNIKKSVKDYTVYFFTLLLGVAIFYVFNAIESQTILFKVTSSTYQIIELMVDMLSAVSVFVSFILGFLIIYASRFLMKRRNKEFGIYMTLGMSKRKISMILFFETLMIGIISLIIGLGIGVILSQFMSLLVANMFEADLTEFAFIFSPQACMKTLIYFGIIYVIVIIFNTLNVNRCQLIDLLYAYRKNEQIKMKNPWICSFVFIVSCSVLGYAYWLVTSGINNVFTTMNGIYKPIVLGMVSTFFIFWSLSGLLIRIFTSMKNIYYKGLNSFVLRQFASKINTTVFSMTIINLMLFVTIGILSSAFSIKNSMTANINELAPVDIQMTSYMMRDDHDSFVSLSIVERYEKNNIDILSYFKEYEEYNIYRIPHMTLKTTLGHQYQLIQSQYPFLSFDSEEDFVKISEYNKIARIYGIPQYTLNKDEYMIIADYESMAKVRNKALENGTKLSILNHTLKPKYTTCQEGFVEMGSNHINAGIILVPDYVIDERYLTYNSIVANFKTTNNDEIENIEKEFASLNNNPNLKQYEMISFNTRLDIVEASVGLGALVTFIGLYLGIIFLISSAAILALKELSESADNKERFHMIRKLGTDEKVINQALFRQIGIFFLFPLLLAIIHSIAGLKFAMFILEAFGTKELMKSILMTAIFIVVIYGGYFFITYLCSKNMIREQ